MLQTKVLCLDLMVGSQLGLRFASKASTYKDVSPHSYNQIPKPGPFQSINRIAGFINGNFEIMNHVCKRHGELGPIYKEYMHPGARKRMVITCDPGDNEIMLRQDGRFPIRPPLGHLSKARKELNFHEGLSECNGAEWHKIRSVVNQHFLLNKSIWSYGEEHFKVASDFVSFIAKNLDENNEIPNFDFALKRWSLEAAGVFSLDTRLGLFQEDLDSNSQDLIEAQNIMFQSMQTLSLSFPVWKLFKSPLYKVLKDSQQRVVNSIIKYRKALQDDTSAKNTQLKSFLDSSELTENEKDMVIFELFSGGIESTAYSSVFPLYLLAKNQEIQEVLRKEVKEYLGKSAVLTGKTIAQMPYLNAVVKETQRLYPFSAFHHRSFDKEVVLSNYRVPPGVSVLNSSNIMNNRDPRYFDNPDEFIPERWFDSKQRKKASFATVGSFGVGARKCPGRKFALQEIHCLIAAVLSRYRLEYHHQPMQTKLQLVVVPAVEPRFTFIPLK